ncbi:hypothetical protein CHRY9390_02985 [Chryseobacterium aquaeductus]|uniref:Uncharacterized protein n=1 Tax=Chryseobacterium aquaeductus TaxID=2675056 RepID=A0A9N8QVW7_9FLAO|nr:hypothetical protein [Chryseobacterium aquaeductus]CAA7332263.1 hypothetical protein CHRY9390_02985 [Chryseobacterium potabilaquae]CAD7815512.1 hypothetical protein CHRY9390_02985 [Chryseobacterium aquaeductus]
MKIIFGSFLFISSLFSAQTSLVEPGKMDTLDISKIKNPINLHSPDPLLFDSAITKLYKMSVAKPKDSLMYSSLKEPVKNNSQFKILNALEAVKTKKIAGK